MAYADVTSAAAKSVKDAIETYGVDFDLLKYLTSTTTSIYKQRANQFRNPVSIKGHISFNPSADILTELGAGDDVTGMITVGRLHMEAAYPLIDFEDTVTLKDEIGLKDKRYRISGVRYTGHLKEVAEILIILFASKPAHKGDAYGG